MISAQAQEASLILLTPEVIRYYMHRKLHDIYIYGMEGIGGMCVVGKIQGWYSVNILRCHV